MCMMGPVYRRHLHSFTTIVLQTAAAPMQEVETMENTDPNRIVCCCVNDTKRMPTVPGNVSV